MTKYTAARLLSHTRRYLECLFRESDIRPFPWKDCRSAWQSPSSERLRPDAAGRISWSPRPIRKPSSGGRRLRCAAAPRAVAGSEVPLETCSFWIPNSVVEKQRGNSENWNNFKPHLNKWSPRVSCNSTFSTARKYNRLWKIFRQ